MKNLVKASLAMLFFSVSLCIFQLSCKKDVSANTTAGADLIVFLKVNTSRQYEIWTADGSGGNQKYVPVTLPAGYTFSFGNEGGQLKLSPGKGTIYFTASNVSPAGNPTNIFSCTITGSNVTKIIDGCANNYDVQ